MARVRAVPRGSKEVIECGGEPGEEDVEREDKVDEDAIKCLAIGGIGVARENSIGLIGNTGEEYEVDDHGSPHPEIEGHGGPEEKRPRRRVRAIFEEAPTTLCVL
jgi:hypothetical protein